MDAWAVLGVAPGSSDRAIREAYLRRARELHPDMGGTDEAMRALNAAYETALSTPPPVFEQPAPPPPRYEAAPPPPRVLRPKRPKKPIYKRKRYYLGAVLLGVFAATSGATDDPSPRSKPAVYGLIGRCVTLVGNDIDAVVPCTGVHDAWVVDVVPRPEGVCPPLATRQVNTVSHVICVNTER